MTTDDWRTKFVAVSNELAKIAEAKRDLDSNVGEREGKLLDLLDDLEFLAAAKSKQELW